MHHIKACGAIWGIQFIHARHHIAICPGPFRAGIVADSIDRMNKDELWAYGATDTGYYYRVKILRVEDTRVLVGFVDEDGVEYQRKKAMPHFLRAPWDDAQEFRHAPIIREADGYAEQDAA
jgi:hypothetical protein